MALKPIILGMQDRGDGTMRSFGAPERTAPWMLGEGRFVEGPLRMGLNFPRPDGETSENAWHRWAHPDMPYEVPVLVQFGSWPYKYTLLEGPDGMTIGEEMDRSMDPETGLEVHAPGENYGVITWPEPARSPGSHRVRVLVRDQMLDSLVVEWTVTVSPEPFVFIDSNAGDDSAAGTIDSPIKTFRRLWQAESQVSDFGGKVAVFREGSYHVIATDEKPSPAIEWVARPVALVGFSGEEVELRCDDGHFGTSGNPRDLSVVGINFRGSRSDLKNNRIFNITNIVDRTLFWRLSFDDVTAGTDWDDNPACIFLGGVAPRKRSNVAIVGCGIGSNCAVQLVVTFTSDMVLMERNVCADADIGDENDRHNGGSFLSAKDTSSNLCIRANVAIGKAPFAMLGVPNQIVPGLAPCENQEMCYNISINSSIHSRQGYASQWNHQTTSENSVNSHEYRNLIVKASDGYVSIYRQSDLGGDPVIAYRNLYSRHDGIEEYEGTGVVMETGENKNEWVPFADVDAIAGELKGDSRADYLGLLGATIAAPKFVGA